jgi:hypothetical protein
MGHGTTVRVKIPLTLAIISALVVTCGGDRYAIPQVSLLELVRLEADDAGKGNRTRARRARLPVAWTSSASGLSQSRAETDFGRLRGAKRLHATQSVKSGVRLAPWLALAVALRRYIFLDAGFDAGLTSEAPKMRAYAGLRNTTICVARMTVQ